MLLWCGDVTQQLFALARWCECRSNRGWNWRRWRPAQRRARWSVAGDLSAARERGSDASRRCSLAVRRPLARTYGAFPHSSTCRQRRALPTVGVGTRLPAGTQRKHARRARVPRHLLRVEPYGLRAVPPRHFRARAARLRRPAGRRTGGRREVSRECWFKTRLGLLVVRPWWRHRDRAGVVAPLYRGRQR
jgi:hypothetical protein